MKDEKHTCSRCGHVFIMPSLPKFWETLLTGMKDIPVSEYVYVKCPECGYKDWASERKFFGALGPKGFYAVCFLLTALFLIAVFVAILS